MKTQANFQLGNVKLRRPMSAAIAPNPLQSFSNSKPNLYLCGRWEVCTSLAAASGHPHAVHPHHQLSQVQQSKFIHYVKR